jgi:hypothetical protein
MDLKNIIATASEVPFVNSLNSRKFLVGFFASVFWPQLGR